MLLLNFNSFAEDFDALLIEAESLRTKNMSVFERKIEHLESFRKNMSSYQVSHLNYLKAFYLSRLGKTSDAISLYESVVEESINADAAFLSLIALVNLYGLEGQTEKAFSNALKFSDEIYNKVKQEKRNNATLLMSYTLLKAGLNVEAAAALSSMETKYLDDRNRCLKLVVESEIYSELSDSGIKSSTVNDDISFCKEIGEHILAYIGQVNIIKKGVADGNGFNFLNLAVSELERVINTKYDNLIAEWYVTLSSIWLDNKGYEQAVRYAMLSFDYDVDQSYIENRVQAYKTLYQAYYSIGDLQRAFKFLKEYELVKSSVEHSKLSSAVAFYSVKLKAEEATRHIASLNKKLSLADLESQVAKVEAENNRLYLSMALIVVCMLILWVYKTKLHQLRLKKQVEVDALTGVLSRRYFSECFEKALVSAQPAQQSVSFVLFDLDHFKRINDSYGHPAGDWVLKAVGEVCSSSGRRADLVGRLGGEEFGILLPDCDMANATRVAEQCRLAIERIDSTPAGAKFQITASFGVSASSVVGYDSRALIVDADKALYLSKKHGRNRVTLSPNYDNSVILGAGI
ncbi:tetratricopeptide repeat-containing diguanylate cyclase [Corallincola spongiicola]|uniref:diguanylate cyclase n=1 Tax=Corallincola spongiicola TaxID=2520508 RepID=A0ABY1WTA4_9GAMM|nr:GGDEF domain-containing protein [Corallincola spongiicola]TAA47968.1 GGDEF domain-containing protein [Corallincola spongiicola]